MGATAEQNGAAGAAERAITMADAAADFLSSGTTPPMVQLIKRQVCRPTRRAATDEELALFISVSRQTQLNPFARQICAVFRWDKRLNDEKMSIQTTIDGFRLIASRTHEWEGYAGPTLWCDAEGTWHDVWLRSEMPKAARVAVWRRGHREAAAGLAHLEMFRDDRSPMWSGGTKVAHMLAKCAEALAFRRAFPQELSGLYTEDEAGAFDDRPTAVSGGESAGSGSEDAPAPQLEAAAVDALATGVNRAAWDDARLAMELVGVGVTDVGDPLGALSTLTLEQATALDQKLSDAVDEATGADEERGGADVD